jgi:hypothetical protein
LKCISAVSAQLQDPTVEAEVRILADASKLKLCRKINDKAAGGRKMDSESSSLSLTTAGSSINAALGSVFAGGISTPESDVTHNGGGPWALVLSNPMAIQAE